MATTGTHNYAQQLGIHNHWAPIVFAIFYFFVFLYNVFRSIRNHGSANVYRGLALFALIRLTAYALRTSMAFSSHAANSRSTAIAYAVLYNVGFFSLLLSAYNLVHNRERLARLNERASKVTSFLHKGRVVHTLLTIATILGVIGAVLALRGPKMSTGTSLFRAMEYMFLGVAAIIFVLTLLLIMLEKRVTRAGSASAPTGNKGHWAIMLTVASLILARMLYFCITARRSKLNRQHNEHFWYPLAALTEALATLLLLTPGLIPIAAHYLEHDRRNKGVPVGENNGAYTGAGMGTNNNTHTGNGDINTTTGTGMRETNNGAGFAPGHNSGFRGGDNVV